jgi:hypothetical protein
VARAFVMKHLPEIAGVDALTAVSAAVGQFALVIEGRIELLRDPTRERVIDVKCVGHDNTPSA